MGDWTILDAANRWESSAHTTLSGHASANTKGDWTQIISSLNGNCCGLLVNFADGDIGYCHLLDIGIGANPNEIAIISDIGFYLYASNFRNGGISAFFPISIPAGTRISGRVAISTGSKAAVVNVVAALTNGYHQAHSGVYTMGANAADSGGTEIDPGGSAGTKGNWVQLSAATPFEFKALGIAFINAINTTRTTCTWAVDIGIGSTPQVIIADLVLADSGTTDNLAPVFITPMPIKIPKGSEVSVRASCTITDATDRLFDIILYGVY